MVLRRSIPQEVRKAIEDRFKGYKICRQCSKRNTWGRSSCARCGNSSSGHTNKKWYRTRSFEPRT